MTPASKRCKNCSNVIPQGAKVDYRGWCIACVQDEESDEQDNELWDE